MGLENLTGLVTKFVNTFHGAQPVKAQPARAQPSNGQQATSTNSRTVRGSGSRRGGEEVSEERLRQRDLPARQQPRQVWRRLGAQRQSESQHSQTERTRTSVFDRLARSEGSDEEVDSTWTPSGSEELSTTDLRDRLNARRNISHGVPQPRNPRNGRVPSTKNVRGGRANPQRSAELYNQTKVEQVVRTMNK